MKRRESLLRLCAFAAALYPIVAAAQSERAINIVVPYAPGGTTDLLGRIVAKEMGQALGRTVIVDNKPGAGTTIGASQVARAIPDGSQLLLATSTTLSINPWLYKSLSYDPAKDFIPVGMVAKVPLILVVNNSVDAKNLGELLALSKAKPGFLSYGSAGNGSPQHLAVELFKSRTGADMTHIPYRGSALAVNDLLAGQVQVMFSDIAPVLQHIKAGKLKALAVTSIDRQPVMPDVPTIAESGILGTAKFEAVAWQILVAPKNTPKAVINQYSSALGKILMREEVRSRFAADGIEPGNIKLADVYEYVVQQTDQWGRIVKSSGARLD